MAPAAALVLAVVRDRAVVVVLLLAASCGREPTKASAELDPDASRPFVADFQAGPTATAPRAAWGVPSTAARIGDIASVWASLAASAGADPGTLWWLEPEAALAGPAPELTDAWLRLERDTWARYALADAAESWRALAFVIARIGGRASLEWSTTELADLPTSDERSATVLRMVALLCARGYALDEAGLHAVQNGLSAVDRDVRYASNYALFRCGRTSAESFAADEVRTRLRDRIAATLTEDDADGTRLAWQALAAIGEIPADVPASILGDSPPPWLVEVEAVRALAGHVGGQAVLFRRLEALAIGDRDLGPRVHVLLEALRRLRGHAGDLSAFDERVRAASDGLDGGGTGRGVDWVICELAWRKAVARGEPDVLNSCGARLDRRTIGTLKVDALVRLAGEPGGKRHVAMLLALADDRSAPESAYALAALAELDDPDVEAVLGRAVAGDDPGRAAAAMGAIAARAKDAATRSYAALPALLAVVGRTDEAPWLETRLAAMDALARLYESLRSDGADSAPALSVETVASALEAATADRSLAIRRAAHRALAIDPAKQARTAPLIEHIEATATVDTAALAGVRGLDVVTDAGRFRIDFAGVPALGNQANLVELARNGMLVGTTWHRVVPGFVTQGGDPRGDGYGGPGYSVPCELSNLTYVRGAVGMALAGRDTGGSQFFVTHAPAPHLDGRYTVVGYVDDGMDVVDRLVVGDKIVRVDVVTTP